MVTNPIILSASWIALSLTYHLGDSLRIYSGDIEPGKMGGVKFTQGMWMGISILMLLPIIMINLSLMLPQPVNRWVNISVAAFLFIFNLIGLPTYRSAYDKFLIAVSLIINVLTVWYSWTWS